MLAWTEPSSVFDQGVDHLGLRVAGEYCYAQLIDFTTTVSWRPRYLSFYCWAAQQAFARAGGRLDDVTHAVDLKVYQKTFKRLDFALAAATLIGHREATRIIGSRAINRRLSSASKGGRPLALSADHVRAPMGGFGVYAGPMRQLDLLRSAAGLDVPMPGSMGERLARAFGRSLAASGVDLLSADALDHEALTRLGEVCGLDHFARRATAHPCVADELAQVRETLVDWLGFDGGHGPSAARVLSIGIILELYRLAGGQTVDLTTFRAATLLGTAELDDESTIALQLPPIYASVLARWRMYQAHAYATLALESLLDLLLRNAHRAAAEGMHPTIPRLVRDTLGDIEAGAMHSQLDLPDGLDTWLSLRLSEVARAPWQILQEPRVSKHVRIVDDQRAHGHDASLLLVLSIMRMRRLRAEGDPWTGHHDPRRLPPGQLIEVFEESERAGASAANFMAQIVERYVLHQHRTTALRKLVARPHADSARLVIEGSRVVPLGTIKPGTSSPRFWNTVEYLAELGYLEGDPLRPSADGLALLDRIQRGTGGRAP